MSGTCSPDRSKTIVSPFVIPLSTSIRKFLPSCSSRLPLQTGHFFAKTLPFYWQVLQGYYICICIMPILMFCTTWPFPLQVGQVLNSPPSAPLPLHLLQYTFLFIVKELYAPVYSSSRDALIVILLFGPFCLRSPPYSNRSTSSSPCVSYSWRFVSSLKTS